MPVNDFVRRERRDAREEATFVLRADGCTTHWRGTPRWEVMPPRRRRRDEGHRGGRAPFPVPAVRGNQRRTTGVQEGVEFAARAREAAT